MIKEQGVGRKKDKKESQLMKRGRYTDKKENKIFLIYRVIQIRSDRCKVIYEEGLPSI
jgi:hypothetical protein